MTTPEPDQLTPDEWCQRKGVTISDPDGWRRDHKAWTDPITETEFLYRMAWSTCTRPHRDQARNTGRTDFRKTWDEQTDQHTLTVTTDDYRLTLTPTDPATLGVLAEELPHLMARVEHGLRRAHADVDQTGAQR